MSFSISTAAIMLGYFVLGGLTWTFLEWLLHGQLFHPRKLRNPFAKEHALHHADPLHMVGWPRKLLGVAFVTGTLIAILRLASGHFESVAFPVGLGLGYIVYESIHRIIHLRAPRTAYGRWLRLQHVQHHFHTPRRNFGVTSAVWDRVFGTYVPFSKPLAVPQRLAMPWLIDPDNGKIADEYARDYVLVRRIRDVPAGADR